VQRQRAKPQHGGAQHGSTHAARASALQDGGTCCVAAMARHTSVLASVHLVRACVRAVQTEPVRGPEDVDVWLFDFGKSMASIDGKMVSGGMWDPKKKPIPNADEPTYDACRVSDYNQTSDIVCCAPHPTPHTSRRSAMHTSYHSHR
jgi:hypothetical protein